MSTGLPSVSFGGQHKHVSRAPKTSLLPNLACQEGLVVAQENEHHRERRYMTNIPALPGLPVTLFGGKGFLRGGTGLGGKCGRRVPGTAAMRLYYR